MSEHVLIPADSSPLSKKAVKAAIAFANEFGSSPTEAGVRPDECLRRRRRRSFGRGWSDE